MRLESLQDRVLALSGVLQAARLVQQLARQGRADPDSFAASVRSILRIDANDTAAVYGGAGGVALGLKLLHEKLGGGAGNRDLEMAKYVLAMLQLEAALRRRPEVVDVIRQGIDDIEASTGALEGERNQIVPAPLLEKLAELYTRTLSTLTPRIMVTGEQGHLANPQIAASVRAVLFAGIRSAVLWRQLGGSRWQLLLSRRRLAREAALRLDALRLH